MTHRYVSGHYSGSGKNSAATDGMDIIGSPNVATGMYQCPKCYKQYSWKKSMLKHLREQCGQEERFKCPHCSAKYHQKVQIVRHLQAHHPNELRIFHDNKLNEFIRLLLLRVSAGRELRSSGGWMQHRKERGRDRLAGSHKLRGAAPTNDKKIFHRRLLLADDAPWRAVERIIVFLSSRRDEYRQTLWVSQVRKGIHCQRQYDETFQIRVRTGAKISMSLL